MNKILLLNVKITLPILIIASILFLFDVRITHADSCSPSFTGTYVDNQGVGYPNGTNTNGTELAEQFTISDTCNMTGGTIWGIISGSTDGSLMTGIFTDSSGTPGASLLSGSAVSGLNTSTFAEGTFTLSGTLDPGTYWFVLSTDGTASATDFYHWQIYNTEGGTSAINISGTWSGTADQYNLTLEGSAGSTTPTTTPTTTPSEIQYVDNPTQDLFNGFILFFIVMIFFVWFFNKK